MEGAVVFFGSDYRVIDSLRCSVGVSHVVTEERSLSSQLVSYCAVHDIDLRVIQSKRDFFCFFQSMHELRLGISCGFGLIFESHQIARFDVGIMNIHYGKLPEIRGRHPLSWAFLLNHWDIGVTFHLVDERIDVGFLLHEFILKRDLSDSIKTVEKRIIDRLPEEISKAMDSLARGEMKKLSEGRYYDNLAGRFDSISSKEHSAVFVFNLFKSQSIYGPIYVDGIAYRDCEIFHELVCYGENWDIKPCKGNSSIALRRVE